MDSVFGYFTSTENLPILEGENIMDDVVSIPPEENLHDDTCIFKEEKLRLEEELSLLRKINHSMIKNRKELTTRFQNFGIAAFSTTTMICAVSLFEDDLAIVTWLVSTAGMLCMIPVETLFGGVYIGSNGSELRDQFDEYSNFVKN